MDSNFRKNKDWEIKKKEILESNKSAIFLQATKHLFLTLISNGNKL